MTLERVATGTGIMIDPVSSPSEARRIATVPDAIAARGIALRLFLADAGPFPVVLAAAVTLHLARKAAAVLRRTGGPVSEALEPESLPEPAVDLIALRDAFAAPVTGLDIVGPLVATDRVLG